MQVSLKIVNGSKSALVKFVKRGLPCEWTPPAEDLDYPPVSPYEKMPLPRTKALDVLFLSAGVYRLCYVVPGVVAGKFTEDLKSYDEITVKVIESAVPATAILPPVAVTGNHTEFKLVGAAQNAAVRFIKDTVGEQKFDISKGRYACVRV